MENIFKTLKLWILITFSLIKRNIKVLLLILVLASITFLLQTRFEVFYKNNVIRIGLIGTYQEHDIPAEVTELLSQPLIKVEEDGHLKANLITGWDTNNDATEFRFKLKPGLVWADGTPIKSSEVSLHIPNTQISFPDDLTIQFNLTESFAPLPSLLTKPIFKTGTLIGTGPYKLKEVDKSRIFITKMILEPKDNLPEVYIRFYPNEIVAVTGFNLGEVQVLMGLNNIKIFSNNPKVEVKGVEDFKKIVTILYQTKGTVLENRSLRQALSYIIPKVEGEIEANNPYPPKHWAKDPDSKKYLSNKDEAEEALKRAKSTLSQGQLKSEIILTATPNLEEVGRTVVDSWKSLGIDAKLRTESGIPQNFQALLITQSIPADPDQYSLWHTTQEKTNLSRYASKRTDKDLEDGRKIIAEEERKVKYLDFQRTLLEDAPAVFLYFPKYNVVYIKKAKENLDKILNIDL